MDMCRISAPVMTPWYAEFKYIEDINKTRNQASHSKIGKVKYKDRSPFNEPDCLCQMYFDVWGDKTSDAKVFWGRSGNHIIRQEPIIMQIWRHRHTSQEIIQAVDSWYDED